MNEPITLKEAQLKLEYYCSYQERCHQEVIQKARDLGIKSDEVDAIVVHLIDRKSTRLNSSHERLSRMPSSA